MYYSSAFSLTHLVIASTIFIDFLHKCINVSCFKTNFTHELAYLLTFVHKDVIRIYLFFTTFKQQCCCSYSLDPLCFISTMSYFLATTYHLRYNVLNQFHKDTTNFYVDCQLCDTTLFFYPHLRPIFLFEPNHFRFGVVALQSALTTKEKEKEKRSKTR